MDVIVRTVELATLGAELRAHVSHNLSPSGEYRVIEHVTTVLGNKRHDVHAGCRRHNDHGEHPGPGPVSVT